MSKIKILFAFSSILSVLVLAGFGCKGLTTEEQAASKPVALEFWTVYDDVDVLNSLIGKFKSDHPYLTVNLRQLRVDELYPRLVEALSEDKGPDIISVYNRSLIGLESKLAPMPAETRDTTVNVVKKTVGSETVVATVNRPLPSASQIDREYVQVVKKDVLMGDKIYGLPLSLDTMAIYYNKDLLDRAGIAEPPKDWAEFQADVKKLTKYNKQTGRIIQSGAALGAGKNVPAFDDILYILWKQSGVDMLSRGGGAVFNVVPQNLPQGEMSPSMSVMSFFADYADPTRDTYTWNEEMDNALDKFQSGSLAFFFGYNYHYPIIKARAPQLNFSVMPMLQLNAEQPVNAASYWVLGVTAKSKNQNEAWNFIRYLTYSKANKEYLDKSMRPSALRAYVNEQKQIPELAPFASQILTADSWYRGKNYEAASKALSDMLHEWLNAPASPDKIIPYRQEVLNRAAQKVNQTL